MENVWVFNRGGNFTSGIFTRRELAESWISKHFLSCCLTKFPLDVGLFDWAIDSEIFKPKRPDQVEARFIGQFTSAALEHYHYESGQNAKSTGWSDPSD